MRLISGVVIFLTLFFAAISNLFVAVASQKTIPQLNQDSSLTPSETDNAENVTITDIQVNFVTDKGVPTTGKTQPYIITREFDLQPGDTYNAELAQQGLERLSQLDIVRKASITLEPTSNPQQMVMVINIVERNPLAFNLSANAPAPSALQGPFQPRIVSPGADEDTGQAVSGSVEYKNLGGKDQNLALRVEAGENVFNTELSFLEPWIAGDTQRTGYAINLFNQRSVQAVFTGGNREVKLPNGDEPWVHRLGGGVEVFRPIQEDIVAVAGFSYQRVSTRSEAFTSEIQPVDELGNPLTKSQNGQDDLFTLNFALSLDQRDNKRYPTRGARVRLGLAQSIPIGSGNI
ncbi:MAG: BamA/TamA family outer membrane protein, partial [Nostocales cyanobacterium 94392]|nr:BamA/TamA family outer membrane protein [Nostocales cyanobacterium 94392]